MYKITNVSGTPQQVKTLDKGPVNLAPGEATDGELLSSYAAVLKFSRVLKIESTLEASQEPIQTAPQPEPKEGGEESVEQRQNGSNDDPEPTDRDGWAALAASKKIDVKKSWSINRIKLEIEKAS